jgi:hypothetical protein
MVLFLNSIFGKTNIDQKQQLAQQALDIMRGEESAERRRNMQKRIDYYFGKQEKYLDKLIEEQFTYPDRLKLQKEIFNVTEMIINDIAILYNEDPYREIKNGSDKDKELYADIIEKSKLNQTMKTSQRLTKLCKTVLIRPVWRNDMIKYDILTPNIFDIIESPNDKTEAEAIIYASVYDFDNIESADVTEYDNFQDNLAVFFYWSKYDHFIFNIKYSKKEQKFISYLVEMEGNPDNINPYGVLPFVVMRDGIPVDQFYLEGGDDLISCNEIVNIKKTEKNHLTKMQAFSVAVRKGAGKADTLILDPSMSIDLPADNDIEKGADFWFETPNPNIDALEKDNEMRVQKMAMKYSLNPNRFTSTGERSSAESLQMQAYDQAKLTRGDKSDWRIFEQELFNITKIVNNYHNTNKLSDNCYLFIDFKDVEIPMTVDQRDAHNQFLYDNDLKSKSRWLMDENQDIQTVDDALAQIEKNQQEKSDLNVNKITDYPFMNGFNKDNNQDKQDDQDNE